MDSGTNMYMPVAPAYGYGNSGFGGSMWGGDGWWVILFLFALMGNGFGGWGGFGGAGNAQLSYDFPWLMNGQQGINTNVNDGFRDAQLASQLTGIQSAVTSGFGDTALGIAGINQNICQTGNGIVAALTNGFANTEASANARQIANLQQAFNSQTAITAGMNNLAMGLQNCCCENRASVADLKYTVATEACADRAAVNDALRDVLAANTASTQRILDQLCQDKIDAKNEKIQELQTQLSMAQLAANNNAQTQTLLNDNLRQTNALEQYLNPAPIPAYVVQNPNCCAQNFGCGCGIA